MSNITKKDFQKRLDRITEIFSDIVGHADDVSRNRCPYRDRFDRCTAEFRCRNQKPPRVGDALEQCGHDGRFDYRSAWQSDPGSYRRAKDKIDKIKSGSSQRRGTRRDREPGV